MGAVKSTCQLVQVRTFAADPEKAKFAKQLREKAIKRHRETIRGRLVAAAGISIVREWNLCGSCFWLGLLVRETAMFYVYADGCRDAQKISEYPTRRILKSRVHLEPCKGCKDHPDTNYPLG